MPLHSLRSIFYAFCVAVEIQFMSCNGLKKCTVTQHVALRFGGFSHLICLLTKLSSRWGNHFFLLESTSRARCPRLSLLLHIWLQCTPVRSCCLLVTPGFHERQANWASGTQQGFSAKDSKEFSLLNLYDQQFFLITRMCEHHWKCNNYYFKQPQFEIFIMRNLQLTVLLKLYILCRLYYFVYIHQTVEYNFNSVAVGFLDLPAYVP